MLHIEKILHIGLKYFVVVSLSFLVFLFFVFLGFFCFFFFKEVVSCLKSIYIELLKWLWFDHE